LRIENYDYSHGLTQLTS